MKRVGVLGGGTAGFFAALALQRRFPTFDLTVIESPNIPVIGVGEASTTLMPPFLHHTLGLDVETLYAAVKPTWKLGIWFDWGPVGEDFTYPFGPTHPLEALTYDGTLKTQSLVSLLMEQNRAPLVREADGSVRSLLHEVKWAYHLHNAPFVALLARTAKARGITHRLAEVQRVETDAAATRVERLHFVDGSSATFDLLIDASGFRSTLLGTALKTGFVDYARSLFCDTALVTEVPHGGVVQPFTTAETTESGWCWRIPVESANHRGSVFSSSFTDAQRVREELRHRNPLWDERSPTSLVRFRSGRHTEAWRGNVIALGNAYGFVEPLESTALHMVIVSLGRLVDELATPVPNVARFNEVTAAQWDSLRWFLAAHYRFNTRLDSPFWRAVRNDVDIGPLQDAVERLRVDGPWLTDDAGQRFTREDPTFGHPGLMMVLLGQRVDARPPKQLEFTASEWRARLASQRELVARALTQPEALEWLRHHPESLRAFVDEKSWLHDER